MRADELWNQYVREQNLENTEYEAWQFGGAPDELADLVVKGIKTATCSLYDLYQEEGEELPREGEYSVILDSQEEAVCIIRTTKVEILPYCSVSEEQAYKEGEGDRSLAYWRQVHERFFSGELSEIGKSFTSDMKVVFEEFQVLFVAER